MSIKTIDARIYWDSQDPNNAGWAWTTRVNDEHDDSGPLGSTDPDESDEMLIAEFRGVLSKDADEFLSDAEIVIIRD